MPKRILKYKFLLAVIASIIVYLALAWVLPNKLLILGMNGLFTGLVIGVALVFWPLVWRTVRMKEFDRIGQLTVGIVLTWVSLIITRWLNVTAQATDNPTLTTDSILVAIAAYLAILGGILHVTAPGIVEHRLKYNRGLLVLAFVIGIVAAAVAIVWQGVPLL